MRGVDAMKMPISTAIENRVGRLSLFHSFCLEEVDLKIFLGFSIPSDRLQKCSEQRSGQNREVVRQVF